MLSKRYPHLSRFESPSRATGFAVSHQRGSPEKANYSGTLGWREDWSSSNVSSDCLVEGLPSPRADDISQFANARSARARFFEITYRGSRGDSDCRQVGTPGSESYPYPAILFSALHGCISESVYVARAICPRGFTTAITISAWSSGSKTMKASIKISANLIRLTLGERFVLLAQADAA